MTAEHCATYRVLRFATGFMMVLVVLAMLPYTPRPTEDIKILCYQVSASILLGAFLMHSVATQRAFQRPALLFPIVVALLVVLGMAAVASDYVAHSLVEWSKWASLAAIYVVVSQLYRTERSARVLLITICTAVALSSIYAFVQKAGLDPFPWHEEALKHQVYQNLPGTFGNPNIAGHTLILALVFAVYLTTLPGTRWCAGFALLFLAHMAFTDQRSGILAIAAAAVLAAFTVGLRRVTHRPALVFVGVILALVVTVVAMIAGTGWWLQRSGGMFAPIDTSLRLRYNAYYSGTEMIVDRPVLGYGPGNYVIANTPYWTPHEQAWFAQERLMNFNVHNDFIEAAVDGGMLGGVLYVLFLTFAVSGGIYLYARMETAAERRLALALAAAFFAFAVDGFFGFNVHVPVSAVLLFVMAGLLDGLFGRGRMADATPAHERNVFWPAVLGAAALGNAAIACAIFMSEIYFQRGVGAQQWQVYAAADEAYARSARLAPWNWLVPYRRGMVATGQGDIHAAAAHYEHALEKNPYYIPAMSYLAQNQFNRAAPVLVGPTREPVADAEATALLDDAAARAQEALALCAVWPESDDILGRVDFVRAMHADIRTDRPRIDAASEALWRSAAGHLQRAIANGLAQTKEPYRLLAQIHKILDEPEQAEAYLFEALDADIHDASTWPTFWDYARRYRAYPQMREALRRRIQRVSPATGDADRRAAADAYRWLARVNDEGLNNREAAAEAYCQAVMAHPLDIVGWNAFAEFAATHRREEEFNRCIDGYASSEQAVQGMLPQIAAVSLARSSGAQALARSASLLADIVRATPDRDALVAQGIPWAARVIAEVDQDEESEGTDLARGRALLGEVFQALDDYETAYRMLTYAQPRLPLAEAGAVASRLASVLQAMARPNDAVDVLRAGLARDPQNGALHMQFARALARAGRTAEARLEYQTMLRVYQLDEATRAQIEQALQALTAPKRSPGNDVQ